MKTLLKYFLSLIAAIGAIILSVVGLMVVFALIGLVLGTIHQWRGKTACYDQESSAENVKVTFVGRIFSLPKSQIQYCYPEEYNSDLAHIEIVGKLPDFSKTDYEPRSFLKHKDEIRLSFYGADLDRDNEDKIVNVSDDLEKEFRRHMTSMLKRDNKQVPRYEKARKTDFGLIWYKPRATGVGARDMYVHKDKHGRINLLLYCYKNQPDNGPTYLTCSTSERKLYGNVFYTYTYERSHLPQALEIEKMMSSFIRNAQSLQ